MYYPPGLIFGGAYYRSLLCVSNLGGLLNIQRRLISSSEFYGMSTKIMFCTLTSPRVNRLGKLVCKRKASKSFACYLHVSVCKCNFH